MMLAKPVISFTNNPHATPGTKQRIIINGLMMAGIIGPPVFSLAMFLLWRDLPGLGEKPDGGLGQHLIAMGQVAANYATGLFSSSANEYRAMIGRWAEEGVAGAYYARLFLAGLAGGAAAAVGFKAGMAPVENYIHVRGRRLIDGKEALAEVIFETAAETKRSGADTVRIHPAFQISNDRRTKHIMIGGSVGGGKTTVILPMIDQAIKAGDKTIIFDIKGDFTAKFKKVVLFAPWDKRTWAWDIGRDIVTKQDARELATRLIEDSKDPMWSNASRQILVGMICKLQTEEGTDWGFRELAELIAVEEGELLDMMATYNPEAIRAVEQAGQTTTGILINLSAFLSIIFDLARAWGDVPKKYRFSFSDWLNNENPTRKVIILQGSGRYDSLMRGYVSAILYNVISRMTDLPDSRTRRIRMFLDEFPQLGKMPIGAALELLRSKGLGAVIGFQDINQLIKIYSKEEANAWMSMCATHIYARISPGDTADMISGLVGKREVERIGVSISDSNGGGRTTSLSREEIPVITPDQLQSELGPTDTGVRSLLLGFKNALILEWPYPILPDVRPARIPAAWCSAPTDNGMAEIPMEHLHARFAQAADAEAEQAAQRGLADMAAETVGGVALAIAAPFAGEASGDFEQGDDGATAFMAKRLREKRKEETEEEAEIVSNAESREAANKRNQEAQKEESADFADAHGPVAHIAEKAMDLPSGAIGMAATLVEVADSFVKRPGAERRHIAGPKGRLVPDRDEEQADQDVFVQELPRRTYGPELQNKG